MGCPDGYSLFLVEIASESMNENALAIAIEMEVDRYHVAQHPAHGRASLEGTFYQILVFHRFLDLTLEAVSVRKRVVEG